MNISIRAQNTSECLRESYLLIYMFGKRSGDLKKLYCARYKITARQYNSIKKQLDGRISSKVELSKVYMKNLQDKIKNMTKFIHSKEEQKVKLQCTLLKMRGNEPNFHKKVKQYRNVKKSIHQKEKKAVFLNVKTRKVRK